MIRKGRFKGGKKQCFGLSGVEGMRGDGLVGGKNGRHRGPADTLRGHLDTRGK